MGNKHKFLFDYNDYIKNIINLNESDDIAMFKSFDKHSKFNKLTLLEGLIITHPIDQSIEIISNRFKDLEIGKEEDGEIFISGEMQSISKYIPLFNNLGYFISTLTIDGEEWLKEYDDDIKPIALFLEPKYDAKINIDNINGNFLYHTSPLKLKDKILKKGLILKAGNKNSAHPERIYLSDNLDTIFRFATNLPKEYNEFYDDGYVIYQINKNVINDLYSDINLRESGYYTIHNINPKSLKVIKEVKN
jgi:hypothetical protein